MILGRQEAIRTGLSRYFTGKPCKNGHIAQRRVKSADCAECHRLGALAARNADIDAQRERDRRKRQGNPAAYSAIQKKYRSANKDQIRAAERRRKFGNLKDKAKCRKWRKANPERLRVLENCRRARNAQAEGSHTEQDIQAILISQGGLCAGPGCRKPLNGKYQVDHIVALVNGGSNWPENLQCLCRSCNSSKGAKDMILWITQKGWTLCEPE